MQANTTSVLPSIEFELEDYPYLPKFADNLPSYQGLKLAYIDEAPTTVWNGRVALCLHGEPTWGYLYRKMIPPLRTAGYRVIAPDLFGFGRSDKPCDRQWFSFSRHRQSLLELIDYLQLKRITLLVQDWGGLLGLTLPQTNPDRYEQLLVMNTTMATGDFPLGEGFKAWRSFMNAQSTLDCAKLMQRACPHLTAHEVDAYSLPFEYKLAVDSANSMAGVMQFPALVPEFVEDDGALVSREARVFWKQHWQGQSFMAIGMLDPVLGPAVMRGLYGCIQGCPAPMELAGGGHFLQEWEDASGDSRTSIVAAALAAWGAVKV